MPMLTAEQKYEMVKEFLGTLMEMSQGEESQFLAGRRDGIGTLQRYCELLDQHSGGDE